MKWIFILPIVIMMFISLEMGRQLYMTDSTRDIYEVTNNVSDKVYGNYYNNTVTLGNESSLNQGRIIKSIGKGMDFVMYGAISFMLYNVEYGFNHPNINYGLFIWICIVILWILLIIPAILLGYIIYLIYVSIRDYIRKRTTNEQ